METPVTPNPMMVKKTVDALKSAPRAETRKDDLDGLIRVVEQKIEDAHAPKTSQERKRYENRKRAQELKKKGMSNVQIAEQMHLPESTIRLLLKPYAPKPHLTQKIEGLDRIKAQMDEKSEQCRKNHPAGRNYKGKRNGGK